MSRDDRRLRREHARLEGTGYEGLSPATRAVIVGLWLAALVAVVWAVLEWV